VSGTVARQQLARTTGLLYVVLVVFGMFSPIVLETLVVPADPAATAASVLGSSWLFGASLVSWVLIVVADVAVSVLLYLLFESFDRRLSLVSAGFRIVYATLLGAYLVHLFQGYLLLTGPGGIGGLDPSAAALAEFERFAIGFRLALIFFGVHLVVFGRLLGRSKYVPGAIAILILAAGVGYILDAFGATFVPGRGAYWSALLLTPALLGEVSLTAWLLFKGVRGDAPGVGARPA